MGKRREDDPIADYVEWSNNRYNPGHYLVGNLPPWLRNLNRSPKRRRDVGISMLISAVLGVATLVTIVPAAGGLSGAEVELWVAFVALVGWVSLALFRPARPSSRAAGETALMCRIVWSPR